MRADKLEGIRGPHEGRAERHLLHHWREHCRRVFFHVLEKFAQDGSRGNVHGVHTVDEHAVQQLKKFNGKELNSTTTEDWILVTEMRRTSSTR